MRKLSEKEKTIVNELLVNADFGETEKLQMGRILFQKINCIGIKCCSSTKTVEIFKTDMANANRSYSVLMGLFSFLTELKDYGYIGIDTIVDNNGTIDDAAGKEIFWIYNHTTHAVENDLLLVRDNDFLVDTLKEGTPCERFHSIEMYNAMRNLVYNKVVYPRPALKELKENGFRSVEEKRHSQNVILQWLAIVVAIAIPILVTLLSFCRGTQIHSKELCEIERKMDDLNQVSITHPDTILIECIQNCPQRQSK